MLKAHIDFRVPQLFVDEVKAAPIEGGLVRVTTLRKRDRGNPRSVVLYVMATAVRDDYLLRLTASVGALTGDKKSDDKLEAKAEKLREELTRDLEAQGATVREGGYITAIPAEAA